MCFCCFVGCLSGFFSRQGFIWRAIGIWKGEIPRTPAEALAAFQLLSRLEGIIPALEPAHAVAKVMDLAPKRPKDHLMVVNLSGRGDKDVPQVGDILKGKKK